MWRLRIAEEGVDPCLSMKNAHASRQVREFDTAANPDPSVDATPKGLSVDARRKL